MNFLYSLYLLVKFLLASCSLGVSSISSMRINSFGKFILKDITKTMFFLLFTCIFSVLIVRL
ncbi:MAG: hypothetical protein QXL16_00395 [Candidatus Micrarchaeaceae archaeon]